MKTKSQTGSYMASAPGRDDHSETRGKQEEKWVNLKKGDNVKITLKRSWFQIFPAIEVAGEVIHLHKVKRAKNLSKIIFNSGDEERDGSVHVHRQEWGPACG